MSAGVYPNLVLAGFMGTGKSTVGALVADRLQWTFLDTDALVEQKAGKSVREIFSGEGEQAFRALEREACLLAASDPFRVIATGGGALLDAESRGALEATGVIVLLTCKPETILSRLEESARKGERPLLGDDPASNIARLLQARQALYSSVPVQVDTTDLTPREAADRVMEVYASEAQDWMAACAL